MHLFCRPGDQLARAVVPEPTIDALRLGRMTALQNPMEAFEELSQETPHHLKVGVTHNGPTIGSGC